MRAIDQLIRVERADVAAEYLDRLVKLSLDDAALAQLYREFGTATMIRLARTSELAPQSSEFALAVMQAGRGLLQDPASAGEMGRAVERGGSRDAISCRGTVAARGSSAVCRRLVEGIVTGDASQHGASGLGLRRPGTSGQGCLGTVVRLLGVQARRPSAA